jgi:hypothetical protein
MTQRGLFFAASYADISAHNLPELEQRHGEGDYGSPSLAHYG